MNDRVQKAQERLARASAQIERMGREFWHKPLAEAVLKLLGESETVSREQLVESLKNMPAKGPVTKPALEEAIARLQNKFRIADREKADDR